MDIQIESAIDKMATAGKTESAPELTGKPEESPAKTEANVPQQPEGKVESPATPEKKQKLEWDGDINKLPPDLQDWAKASQRKFTEQAMAYADLRRKGQEYSELQNSEDWKQFQEWKLNPTQSVSNQPAPQIGITSEEWEAAQLDSSGKVANDLIQREVRKQIEEAAKVYGTSLQALRQESDVTKFRTALSDFAEVHPDAVELHELGLMQPLLSEELKSNKHQTYEAAINAAYERGTQIRQNSDARALQKAQGRVAEKKDAVTVTGTATGDITHYEVNSKADVFDKAIDFALQNKRVKVKAKN